MYNKIILMGRITHDLELKTTPNGRNVCTFSIAVDRRFADKDGNRQTDFFNIVAWNQQADHLCRWFSKGRMVLVEGEMTTRRYTDKKGTEQLWYEVSADRISFTGERSTDTSAASKGYYPDEPPSSAVKAQQNSENAAQKAAPKEYAAEDYAVTDDDYPF
ncbi:MAG: single-stranded DNA-binding protein [Oscillospiraceae bacterium]|nr:single-stranded DNA-binding protein [Oscillospiraceae bacterium]